MPAFYFCTMKLFLMDNENNMSMSLTRFFSGDALPDEAMQIDKWIRASETNKKVYSEFLSLWYAKSSQKYLPVSAGVAWQELEAQLRPSARLPRQSDRYRNWAIAASVVLLATVVAMIVYFNSAPKATLPAAVVQQRATDRQPVRLPDNSTVFLDKNAEVLYPAIFGSDARSVSLSGNAYFRVVPDKLHPFRIISKQLTIDVIGTSFAITRDSLNRKMQVAVESGTVRVSSSRMAIVVQAGQTADYSENTNTLRLIDSIDINSFSYATRRFSFRDLSLREITGHLENAFATKFSFSQPALDQCRMSADFDNESLEYILSVIASTLNLKYTIDQNTVYFSGDVCK